MRIIVPLQGVVQGRGGLVLGSLIPCALFYFLQLYITRNRPPAQPGSPTAAAAASVANSTASPIHRALSRGLLTPRALLPAPSARGALVCAGDEDSLYYAGIRRCADDLYHPDSNPAGMINLAVTRFGWKMDFDGGARGAVMLDGMTGTDDERDLTTYHPYDGILALKMASQRNQPTSFCVHSYYLP